MTPAARVQAAIDIVDLVIDAARNSGASADRITGEWFRTRRFAGSSDRRAVRELAYAAIRRCGEVPQTGRAAMLALAQCDAALAALFDGTPHAPAAIAQGERVASIGIAPAWLETLLAVSTIEGAEAEALLGRAPLDIRVNTLRTTREAIDLPVPGIPTVSANALRLPAGTQVDQWPAFNTGQIEVQDTGSQLVCEAVQARPGETIIDLCAGAGGKTLALAAAMENRGRLIACDTDRGRLSRLPQRAGRAGVSMAQTVLLDPGREVAALTEWAGKADAVLIDAPCSGTGTWRRNPEGRWRLTARELERLMAVQARLLDVAAALVRPGGRLIHVVCSLLDGEGADQVVRFLGSHSGWRAEVPDLAAGQPRGPGLRMTPLQDSTDGFFVARLVRL